MTQPKTARPVVDWDKVARLFLGTVPFFPAPAIYDLIKDFQWSRGELSEKVNRAAVALQDASKLVAELESGLSQKLEQVQKLKTEYGRYQQLATIEEAKAKALVELLQDVLGADRGRERWIALGINLAAGIIVFILGVWLSPWIRTLLGIQP